MIYNFYGIVFVNVYLELKCVNPEIWYVLHQQQHQSYKYHCLLNYEELTSEYISNKINNMPQRSQAQAGYRQNVGFFKAGNLHRPAGQGVRVGDMNMAHRGRMSGEALGSRRRAPGARDGQVGQEHVVETVTLDLDSDNETLNWPG